MYAIMGATGQTGGAVLRALQRRGAEVRAISRDAGRARAQFGPGVEVAQASAEDVDAMARAFAGARGVYVINAPVHDAADLFAAAGAVSAGVAAALDRARPARVVALSSEGAHQATGAGIIRTLHDFEAALVAVDLPMTRIRAAYFMENWAAGLAPAEADGVLPSLLQPLDRPIDMVSIADIGDLAADMLLAQNPPTVVNLMGPALYSPEDAAAAVAQVLGRPVVAVAPPRADWEPALTDSGLGAAYAAELAAMYDAINADAVCYEPGVGLDRRGSVTLAEAVAALGAPAQLPLAQRRPA